jgi:hypothetical protein
MAETIVVVLLLLVGVPYVLGPILVGRSLRIKARPQLEPVEVAAMPADVYEYFGQTAQGLAACRFELVAYLLVRDQVPNVTAYVALWVGRTTGQAAVAIVTYAGSRAVPNVQRFTEFLTRPAPGVIVLTANTSEYGTFKRDPKLRNSVSLEDVQDVAALYQVHLNRESRLIPASAARYLPPPGKEVDYFADEMEQEIRTHIATGRHSTRDGEVFHPTPWGACVMTWGQLFPIKQIRKRAMRRRAAWELSHAQPLPFPSNVRITEQLPRESDLPTTAPART